LTHNDVVLLDRITELVGSHGAVYRTRATEVSALLDLSVQELEPLLDEIRSALVEHQRKASVGVGVVNVPQEAADAVSALAVADERLIDQPVGLRVVRSMRAAVGTDDEGDSGLAVVIDLVPRAGGRPTRRAGGLATPSERRSAAALASFRRS